MNEALIARWNSIIQKDDIVYNLGDVFLGTDKEQSLEMVSRLNGQIYYAYGNHCTDNKISALKLLHNTADIQFGYRIKYRKVTFLCNHYPMLVGNYTNDRVWNLHGHTHQTTNFSETPCCYHVGVDSHNCYPIEIEQIYQEISKKRKENFNATET